MVAILSAPSIRNLWDGFGDCLCSAYSRNSERLPDISHWFTDLFDRRIEDEIDLSRCRIESQPLSAPNNKPTWRRAFNAYCVNGQMCISTDHAVLTWPHASTDPNNLCTKSVGIWLHDFGSLDQDSYNLLANALEPMQVNDEHTKFYYPDFPRHIRDIADTITSIVDTEELSQRTTKFPRENWQLRVAKDKPRGLEMHSDDINLDYRIYERAVLHALMGSGTVFQFENGRTKVATPLGATSAHIANTDGIQHKASGNSGGRVALCCGSQRDMKTSKGFWQRMTVIECAL